MSNFIDERERHAELYGDYTGRQRHVLELARKAAVRKSSDEEIQDALLNNGVTASEIQWLKRNGHYLPANF